MVEPLNQGRNIMRRSDRGIEHNFMIAEPGKLLLLKQDNVLIQASADNIHGLQKLL